MGSRALSRAATHTTTTNNPTQPIVKSEIRRSPWDERAMSPKTKYLSNRSDLLLNISSPLNKARALFDGNKKDAVCKKCDTGQFHGFTRALARIVNPIIILIGYADLLFSIYFVVISYHLKNALRSLIIFST